MKVYIHSVCCCLLYTSIRCLHLAISPNHFQTFEYSDHDKVLFRVRFRWKFRISILRVIILYFNFDIHFKSTEFKMTILQYRLSIPLPFLDVYKRQAISRPHINAT